MLSTALTATRVLIATDAATLATRDGQTALVTAATLMARSGHEIWIDAPETDLIGSQPPLQSERLIEGLFDLGEDLLPGVTFRRGRPVDHLDLAVLLGCPDWNGEADQVCALDAGDGWASLGVRQTPWSGSDSGFGAMAAGAMAAGEAFKAAMRKLSDQAISRVSFDRQFAASGPCTLDLHRPGVDHNTRLTAADVISGGAIGNALVYALLRVPGIQGRFRVMDDDVSDLSNLNRNALLRCSAVGRSKVDDLASHGGPLEITPSPVRFVEGMPLARTVLVGVDDIPSRWAAQRSSPAWLGVGATSGYSVQVSSHTPDQACAGCLHPENPVMDGAIPTVAFVSFWAGFLLALRWLNAVAGEADSAQQTFFCPLRPEGWRFAANGVAPHPACPVGCAASRAVEDKAA